MPRAPASARKVSTNARVEKAKCPSTHKFSKKGLQVSSIKLYDVLITVKVGSEEQEFQVHQGLICHHSSFFRGAMRNACAESESDTVLLPNVETATFQEFFTWLYLRQLSEPLKTTGAERMRLVKLWVFAETYIVPEFQNAALDALHKSLDKHDSMPAPSVINYVYENTIYRSPLRKLFIDLVLEHGSITSYFDPAKVRPTPIDADFCQEVLFNYALRYEDEGLNKTQMEKAWDSRESCHYHVHNVKDTVASLDIPKSTNAASTARTTSQNSGSARSVVTDLTG